jgi:ABC-2 type transport system ATP-binding protein
MICDRVVIINRGKIVADDTLQELRQKQVDRATTYVETDGPSDEVLSALGRLEGVIEAQRIEEASKPAFRVRTQPQADPREAIHRLCADRNWPLRELKREIQSLEEIFIRLVMKEEGADSLP